MPMAVPMVASIAASSLAVEAGLVVAGSFAAQVIGAGASIIASVAMNGISGKSGPDTAAAQAQALYAAGAGRTQQVRQPITAHTIIYGRIKTSGPIVFVHTKDDPNGRANGYLYFIHPLAGCHVKAIGDVYLGDLLTTDSKFDGDVNERLVRVGKHLGATDQVADADYVSEIGGSDWTTNHRGRGIAYIATRLRYDSVAYASGIPNISAMVDGHDEIYDPRDGSTGYTNNAALIIANWLTSEFGMNLAWAKLDEDSVIAAADICDERVLLNTRTTTFSVEAGSPTTNALVLAAGHRVLDWGDGVRVSTSGSLPSGLAAATTYYVIPSDNGTIKLASSVANAFAGTAISVSGGSGTQTLSYYDEARYKLNGSFTLDTPKRDVLERLVSAMAGVVVYLGGKWFVHAGAAAAPTVTLSEDDLRADFVYTPKRSKRDRFNGVRSVYVSPEANWQPTDAPPLLNATYLAEDDGEPLYQDIPLPFTTSTPTAQRLMKIALERNRRQGVVEFPAKLTAMRLAPWDGMWLTVDRYFDQAQFRVAGWALAEDGGIDLTLQEDDANVYAWDATEEQQPFTPQGVTVPDPSTIAAPADIIVDTPIEPTYSRLNATVGEVKSIWFDGYDVEFRPSGTETWSSTGRIYTELVSMVESVAIDIQARAVTFNGSPSAFTQNLAPGMPTDVLATGTTITWTNDPDATEVQVFTGIGDFANSTLHDTVDGADESIVVPNDAYYWLRSVNAQGNVSNATTSVTVGTPGGSGGGDGGGDSGGDEDGGGDGGGGDE